jgi:hypothetical protein
MVKRLGEKNELSTIERGSTDHLYTTIMQAKVTGTANGKTTSTTVHYTASFRDGAQEGVVAVYIYSQADGSIMAVAMMKVMLSAKVAVSSMNKMGPL